MLGVEDVDDILSELINGEDNNNGLPPGFRFHPTDEELITFYLASKVFNGTFSGVDIAEVDLNRCEPWELPDVAKMGEREWYFFSLRDRKYPTGLRTNRATGAGYWKATGKDREVYSASTGALLGMKKTLVFYRGRAPRGEKTKWVMHEYRLDGDFSYRHTCKEEWVICRIFHKTGEKKNGFLQGHSYLLESAASFPIISSSSSASLLPPLLETPIHQKPFLVDHHHQHENPDLKYLINTTISQSDHLLKTNMFATSFSPAINNNSSLSAAAPAPAPSPSMLLKSLLSSSHQDFTVPKQCKTDANINFLHFQVPAPDDDANNLNHWMEKITSNQNPYQNPLFFEMGCSNFRGSSTTAGDTSASTVHDMSTPVGSQMMLDPPIRIPAVDSWPLDP